MNFWNEERLKLLAEMATELISTEIAAIFGKTRNSIIGVCRRNDIPLKARFATNPQERNNIAHLSVDSCVTACYVTFR